METEECVYGEGVGRGGREWEERSDGKLWLVCEIKGKKLILKSTFPSKMFY